MNIQLILRSVWSHGWGVVARGRPPSISHRSPAHLTNLLIIAALLALFSACGTTAGQPEQGRKLFNGEELIADGDLPSCVSCHADTPQGISPLGPNLSNIGNRAATTVPGQSAEDYLRTSIIDPDAFLAGGYQEGIMERNYSRALSQQQINDLVAYMLTLTSGVDK